MTSPELIQVEPEERSFLKGNSVYCPWEQAQFVIMQAPYEESVSFGTGTSRGPSAIISASEHLELYDIHSEAEPFRAGISTLAPVSVKGSFEKISKRVHSITAEILRNNKTPVLLGGEHSVSYGAVKATHERFPDLGVLQLDAHADLRDKFQGSEWSHACIMRRVYDLGITHAAAGVRSMSAGEAEFIRQNNLEILPPVPPETCRKLLNKLPDKLYITLDIDVLDPSVMPATGTPEPGGYTWNGLTSILEAVSESGKEIVAFDVVELAPAENLHFCEYTTARLIYGMIGMFRSFRPAGL